MQTTDRHAAADHSERSPEQQPARGPQPIDPALLHLIGGGVGEVPDPVPSPKGGW